MAILTSEIVYRLSGGAGNTSPASSLGLAMGTAAGAIIASGSANNLWDDVSSGESTSGDTEYRCIYVTNTNSTLTLTSAVLWVDTSSGGTTSGDTTIDVALDPAAVGSSSTTSIANENTAPSGVTFAGTAVSKGTGLAIGDIPAGSRKAFWVKRVVNAGAAAASDTASFRVEGNTTA